MPRQRNKNKTEKLNLTFVKLQDSNKLFSNTSITPSKIIWATNQKERDHLKEIYELFNTLINNDLNLAGVIDTRIASLKSRKIVLPENLSPLQIEYFEEINKKFLPKLVEFFIYGKLKGAEFGQVKYTLINDKYHPTNIKKYKHPDLRIKDDKLELFIEDYMKNTDSPIWLKTLFERSILLPVAKYYLFASFALNNWASFTEIFGKPVRVGKYNLGATKPEKDELWEMLQNSGTDLAAMISENVALEFVDHVAKTASADLYNMLLSFTNNAVTKRILGQTLATDAQKSGSYAQAKIHNLVREDITFSDAQDLTQFISDFYTMLNNINFNSDEIVIEMDLSRPMPKAERIAIDEKLDNIIEIPAEYFYKTYGIPMPKNPQKKAKPTQPTNGFYPNNSFF